MTQYQKWLRLLEVETGADMVMVSDARRIRALHDCFDYTWHFNLGFPDQFKVTNDVNGRRRCYKRYLICFILVQFFFLYLYDILRPKLSTRESHAERHNFFPFT